MRLRRQGSRTRQRAALCIGVAVVGLLAGGAQAFADSVSLSATTTTGASDPVAGVSRIFTLSGASATPKEVFVKFRAPGGAACAPTADEDSGDRLFDYYGGDSDFYGGSVNGAFSFRTAQTWPRAGTYVFCYWIASDSTTISTPFTQTITFRPPTGSITATITPIRPQPNQAATIDITGSSESPENVYATVRSAGGAACAQTYDADSGTSVMDGTAVNGAFALQATTTQSTAGSYVLCLWLAGSSTDTAPVAGPQPEPFTVAPPPQPPQHTRVVSGLSLRRASSRPAHYSGHITTLTACRRNRIVVLRRIGSGSRTFASTRTRTNGTYTLARASRLHGTLYAVVASRRQGLTTCLSSRSRTIRG